MKAVKWLLFLGFSCLLAGWMLNHGPATAELKPFGSRSPVVKLFDVKRERAFCSGTVISDHYVLTAAHCIAETNLFGVSSARKVKIELVTQGEEHTGIIVTVLGFDVRSDLAVLKGDVSKFDKLGVFIEPGNIIAAYKRNNIIVCGYPKGGRLFCNQINYTAPYVFEMAGTGFLYPGMSGGPVVDTTTGRVIGVNTAMDGAQVILSPTIELWMDLGIDAEFPEDK